MKHIELHVHAENSSRRAGSMSVVPLSLSLLLLDGVGSNCHQIIFPEMKTSGNDSPSLPCPPCVPSYPSPSVVAAGLGIDLREPPFWQPRLYPSVWFRPPSLRLSAAAARPVASSSPPSSSTPFRNHQEGRTTNAAKLRLESRVSWIFPAPLHPGLRATAPTVLRNPGRPR